MNYSPTHHHNHRKRKIERSYDRDHYSSKRDSHKSVRDRDPYDKSNQRRYSPRSPSNSRNSRKRRKPASPMSPRSHSAKRHSRSRSPRYMRSTSPFYSSARNSRAITPRTPSPSKTTRRIDFNNKISDTSLFAELVKDKHKRHKVLQEILDKKEEISATSNENSNSALSIDTNSTQQLPVVASAKEDQSKELVDSTASTIESTTSATAEALSAISLTQSTPIPPSASTNGVKENACIVDIPMPNRGTDVTDYKSTNILAPPPPPPPPPPAPLQPQPQPNIADEAPLPASTSSSSSLSLSSLTNSTLPVIQNIVDDTTSVNLVPVIKATYTIQKPKCLTKLPMPPGVNMAELEDINTPSPPRSISPVQKRTPPPQPKQKVELLNTSTSNTKKGLLNLPMPPMVPGSEDLSGDDEIIGSPPPPMSRNSTNKHKKEVKRKRPTIINRRNSRSQQIKDWGERCVDVFEVIAQIGEGTYGQVKTFTFIF